MNNFMEEAIKQAKLALKKGEVPIGAVVVFNGKIIAKGHNLRETKKNALLHAEMVAINHACKKRKDWRLEGCQIYVTLEPCPMCAGAIANSRIEKVFYGAQDKTANDHLFEQILSSNRLNHKCEFEHLNDYQQTCSELLSEFFKSKRTK